MALGQSIPETTGPDALYGQTLSLNFKACKWLDMPTRDPKLHFDTENPTLRVPGRGTIHSMDLEGLWRALQSGQLVLDDKPVPEFTKVKEVMDEHVGVIQGPFPSDYVKSYIADKVVNGANLQGGFSKIEILENMLEAEAINPVTQTGGKNRAEIVEWLKEAITHCEEVYGGVSKVRREAIAHEESSSMRRYATKEMNQSKAKNFLGVK